MQVLQMSLDAATLRQQVYANNIANAETPNYKRQDVAFETYFQQALNSAPQAQMGETHIPLSTSGSTLNNLPNVQPTVYTDTSSTVDNDGNNVDLSSEMVDVAENQVKYEVLAQDLSTRFQRLTTAIQGG
ncbi:flagellar basal body rod protein FlgB [Alicyclobacillus fastidiosus]|uniref:Flagellar basal body rod protein FlgB n=1 Tax=Alicyclobacillus fastidiosus TaxID=392011 RepID=A0ABV5AGQ5_9BACL|nr:flagellar basal body rod protein FlgB [Alicyclobacillus fastidiosus]WEH07932.1 flagellar basal body rod protein FlgB [Alicyclobacillus fastidiosus]